MIIARYILKEHIGPFLLALAVLSFVLIMNRVFELVDLIIGKGLDVKTVLEVFVLSLPFILAVTVPMAVLVAALMAFGRLSQDWEIVALKTSGVNMMRILSPILLASILLSMGMVYFNNHILPESNHRVKNLLIDIAQKKPTLKIKEGVFIQAFKGFDTFIRKIDQKTQEIHDIVIYEINKDVFRTIIAGQGEIFTSPEGGMIEILLLDGEIHELLQGDWWRYRRLKFQRHRLRIPVENEWSRQERTYRGDRELSARDMKKKVDEIRISIQERKERMKVLEDPKKRELERRAILSKEREINRYLVEIHKKYSIPFSSFAFLLIGAPLGIAMRRGGMGVGFGIALLFFVLYYIALVVGEELADRKLVLPLLAMWTPNLLLSLIGGYLLYHIGQEKPFRWWKRKGRP
ncbi:LptF/LptG family permease [candidate division TA06 bacterium]|nr:LptF/LptG family permease [candidate division TA06 bacterium]